MADGYFFLDAFFGAAFLPAAFFGEAGLAGLLELFEPFAPPLPNAADQLSE